MASRNIKTGNGIFPGPVIPLFLRWVIISVKTPASANPIKIAIETAANTDANSIFICHPGNGAGTGFEPVCDPFRPRSLLSPRSMINCKGRRGLGFPKGIPTLKGKRGKMRTRPPADRSACCEPNLSIEGLGTCRHHSQNAKNMPLSLIFIFVYISIDYKNKKI